MTGTEKLIVIRGQIIASYLCQIMILALLGYGLNLGCLLASDGCAAQGSICCANCNLPAQLDKVDHSVHAKLGPALLPTDSLSLLAIVVTLGEVESPMGSVYPPRMLPAGETDPVRGPPLAS